MREEEMMAPDERLVGKRPKPIDGPWAKYRKKPVVIEAYQTDDVAYIPTLEGVMTAQSGDWIIRGIAGELYPCKLTFLRLLTRR